MQASTLFKGLKKTPPTSMKLHTAASDPLVVSVRQNAAICSPDAS